MKRNSFGATSVSEFDYPGALNNVKKKHVPEEKFYSSNLVLLQLEGGCPNVHFGGYKEEK